jgi:4-methylaminobutanoate oxidase (formaldehyde-forming)
MSGLPAHARVVVIGGGIVGTSVAYHLARLGWRDVVLLERGSLSCGTTWHAAGLVGQLRPYLNMTRLVRYSTELYASLEAETGHGTGWKRCGSVTVARTDERLTQLKRTASLARAFGVEAHLCSPQEAGKLWPLMRTDDLVGAVWLPGDGKANPADLTQALARGARTAGIRIFEDTPVTGLVVRRGRAAGVRTPDAEIAAEHVVLCAGLWARELAWRVGVAVPLHAVEHMYIVTKPIEGVFPDLPVMRDPDGMVYFKEEVGGLVMGGFEPNAKPWGVDGVPADFSFSLLEDDWAQFEPLMAHAIERVPALETAGVHRMVNGPESFTADNNFIVGEAPELPGLFVAAGFNSAGIASAGGAGRALAEWIVDGRPSADLWPVDIRRFARVQANAAWIRERVREIPGLHYAIAWPFREFESGRNVRRSPLYDRLAARRACFGAKMGWERANWFAPEGVEPRTQYAWAFPNWFPHAAAEHRAAREAVAVWDQTSFSKFLLEGPDAEAVLQRLCVNDVAVQPGRIVYTGMLNDRGGYESDLTVSRVADDAYFIVTGTAQTTRDFAWIRCNIPEEARARLTDVTSAWAVLGVMGPRSRTLLVRLTDADLSNEAFPFSTSQEIPLGRVFVRAMRITYVGELGWELYVPTESAVAVYDLLKHAGEDLGFRDAGFYALDSLRMEKAYRAWGRDVTPDDTPIEAGLEWAVRYEKNPAFLGRDALLRQKAAGVRKRLVSFTLDDPKGFPLGDEPIIRDGEMCGWLTSAAYGHSLGRAVGMGYLRHAEPIDRAWVEAGNYEIEIAGERYRATAHLRPPFDPKGERFRA